MENSKKCQEQIWYTANENKIYSESVSLDFLEWTYFNTNMFCWKLLTKTSEAIISSQCMLRIKGTVFYLFCFG